MVNLEPALKFEIVEKFQETGNKTKTGEVFGVSPRTVGRIVKEYEGLQDPYLDIYKLTNQLILPENILADYLDDEYSVDMLFFKLGCIEHNESVYANADEETTFKQVFEYFDPSIVMIPEFEIDEEEVVELTDEMADAVDDEYDYELIASPQTITITRTDGVEIDSIDVAKGTSEFRDAWLLIRDIDLSDDDQVNDVCAQIWLSVDDATKIEAFSQGKVTVDPAGECVVYDGNLISNKLSNRIINMVRERGQDGVQALVNFLEKLMENPSYRAVNSLYDFLLHNDIEIGDNGNFYAWKRVRDDFTDCRTGTIDNSVGTTVEMPRNMVNEDPEQTCSHGLHVAAKHYLSSFTGPNVLKCEVDPRDVVAIPKDYNNSKMRVCKYVVKEDCTHLGLI